MKTFAERIIALVSLQNKASVIPDRICFDFVKTRKGILKELIISKTSGNLLGVYSKALGEGMFLTVVENIEADGKEDVVQFNRYDMSGHILARTKVAIDEIEMVCPFNKTYRNPGLNSNKSGKSFNRLIYTAALA